jgi:hypothetical protein
MYSTLHSIQAVSSDKWTRLSNQRPSGQMNLHVSVSEWSSVLGFFFFFLTQSHYVAPAGLELETFLLEPPE